MEKEQSMKYIRMKDGTIVDTSLYKKVVEREFNGEVVAIDLNHWGQDNNKAIQMIKVKDITKQADIIEELCDEFVMIDEENEHYIKQDNDIHHIRRKWALGNYKVYGAIWTDKGLVYVAKLNEKGELELI